MYQSSSSTATTTAKTNFVNPNYEFELRHQEENCRQKRDEEYHFQKSINNTINSSGLLASNGNTNEPTSADPSFPKFEEFNALINSDEFLDFQACKSKSHQQQQQSFNEKTTSQAQQQQQRRQQQEFQQVNSFCAPESFSENNNIATSENTVKATTIQEDNCNIDNIVNSLNQPISQQQTLSPKVQVQFNYNNYDNDNGENEEGEEEEKGEKEGQRSQYINQYQLMKETIYQETKSFFYDNYYNPTDSLETSNNMANNHQHNASSYRDIYDNIKQEKPFVEIVEQPAKCSLRFRYKCEGRSAGSLPGVNSSADNKTYPSIRIKNYTGRAVVVISCVTKDAPYLAHPHNIVGKEGCKKGTCTVVINTDPTMIRSFSSLGIQCVKRKDIEESLSLRESIHVDPFRNGFAHKLNASNIDLNVVRLCFQVFIEGSTQNKYDVPLTPVVSDPIHDKKAMSDLVITKLSHCTAPASGGREVILLCDRISRDDIQIRFFEERDGKLIWETYTELAPTDVHKQVAICFKTPKYFNEHITQPVTAYIQLKRLSDNQVSEPRLFKFLPSESDEEIISRKRQKIHQFTNHNLQQQQQQQQQQHHHHHHHNHQHPQAHHQQQQAVACNFQAQNRLQHQSPILQPQQQSSRIVSRGQDNPFLQANRQQGRSSVSPHSRIASPVQAASSPATPALLDGRIQQCGTSPAQTTQATSHLNQSIQDPDTYMIEKQQHDSFVRREIITDDGKVVRLVDRPSQQSSAQASSSNASRNVAESNQGLLANLQHNHQRHDDNTNKPMGLSLARIDSDQLMRADRAFNPNLNLDLGSSISIHFNGISGNGNSAIDNGNNHTTTMPP